MIEVTQQQVEDALEHDLSEDEAAKLAGRIRRASNMVEGYIGFAYQTGDTIPTVVTDVVAGAVARLYVADDVKLPDFQDSQSQTMGPFSATTRFNQDASAKTPWLTKADKTALRPVYSGMRCVGAIGETVRRITDDDEWD